MFERYTSERLQRESPRPLLNFLWYLWDIYCDPSESEFRITLKNDTNGQQFVIRSAGVTVIQNFGCSIDADIVIRKCGARVFMERD